MRAAGGPTGATTCSGSSSSRTDAKIAKLAGEALASLHKTVEVNARITIDATVMATAALHGFLASPTPGYVPGLVRVLPDPRRRPLPCPSSTASRRAR